MRRDIIDAWLLENSRAVDGNAADGRAENVYAALTEAQAAQLSRFQDRLLEVNQYMNLTAITDEADIARKHFIDSLSVLPYIPDNARVIDLGTGAGFPGLPVKIARPDIGLTLLDSLRKRVLFLQETIDMLGLTRVECIHGRAEELGRQKDRRAAYDIATVRAVAQLGVLVKYAMPLLKPGGLLLALKGPDVAGEIKKAMPALVQHGGAVLETRAVRIEEGMVHTVVVVRKNCNP